MTTLLIIIGSLVSTVLILGMPKNSKSKPRKIKNTSRRKKDDDFWDYAWS